MLDGSQTFEDNTKDYFMDIVEESETEEKPEIAEELEESVIDIQNLISECKIVWMLEEAAS